MSFRDELRRNVAKREELAARMEGRTPVPRDSDLGRRLERIATDESDPDAAAWALRVLDGRESLLADGARDPNRVRSADGGEGNHPGASVRPGRDAGSIMNDVIREGIIDKQAARQSGRLGRGER